MTAWFNKHYDNSLKLREYANTMDNDKFDKLVSLLNLPLISNLAANTNLPVLGIAAKAVQLRNVIKKNRSEPNKTFTESERIFKPRYRPFAQLA
jgi:hypothetical protein